MVASGVIDLPWWGGLAKSNIPAGLSSARSTGSRRPVPP